MDVDHGRLIYPPASAASESSHCPQISAPNSPVSACIKDINSPTATVCPPVGSALFSCCMQA